MSSFKKADGIIDSIQKQATGLRTLDGSAIEDFLSIAGYEKSAGGGGGFAHYTDTGGTLDCSYNDIVADITAGRLPYISNSGANIIFGALVTLDTENDSYEAWFGSTGGTFTVYYSETAEGYLTVAD